MDAEELHDHCLSLPGSQETFPFAPTVPVYKVAGKIFAIVRFGEDAIDVSLKCEPALAEQLREAYPSVRPGWHLNKRHWNTVTLGGSLGDALLRDMVEDSYDLVVSGLSQARRRALRWGGRPV